MHHSDAGWTCARRFEELLDIDEDGLSAVAEFVPRFGMVLHDISHASDDELMSRAMTTFARITLLLFRHGRKPKDPQEIFERLGKYVAALHELLAAPNGARAFVAILRYLESITPRSRGEVVKALQKTMRISEEQYNYIAFGDEYIHEKGVEKGRVEGRVEGRREAVLLLLGDRFGRLPGWVVEVVNEATTSRLTKIMRRILRAETLPEVLGTDAVKAKRKTVK